MYSDRMHIDQRNMKAGDREETDKVIDENDFKNAKYIIDHVGWYKSSRER